MTRLFVLAFGALLSLAIVGAAVRSGLGPLLQVGAPVWQHLALLGVLLLMLGGLVLLALGFVVMRWSGWALAISAVPCVPRRWRLPLPRVLAASTLLVLLAGPTPVVSAAQNWTVYVGGSRGGVDLLDYYPGTIQIHVGDTVTWHWLPTDEDHSVTFLSGANMPPTLYVPAPKGSAGPRMWDPSKWFPSAKQGDYNGSGFVNSGMLSARPDQAVPTWSLTFTKGGTFHYECFKHDVFMQGDVVVAPAGTSLPSAAEQLQVGLADM